MLRKANKASQRIFGLLTENLHARALKLLCGGFNCHAAAFAWNCLGCLDNRSPNLFNDYHINV